MNSPLKQNRVVPLASLAPHPDNYRGHPESQLRNLEASLRRFGQGRSIVVQDGPEGLVIVAGHGVVEAARRLHYGELRADILPADWSPEQIRGYLVADNQHNAEAVDDTDVLLRLLQEQKEAGYDLASLGADDEMLRQMLEAAGEAWEETEEDEEGDGGDEYETPDLDEVEIRVNPGEIWALGRHRLACIDAGDERAVARLMNSERAVCCWTDPPYGVSYVGKTKEALTLQNDEKGDLEGLLVRAFSVVDKVLEDGSPIYVAHPAGILSLLFGSVFVDQGWRFHETLIWVKDSMVLGHSDYHYQHEPILFGYKQGGGRRGRGAGGWYGDNAQTTVFQIPRPKRSESHPTMKPIELIAAMLTNSCPPGGLIYEPFGGSGSTLIAAHRLHMRCYACEIDPRYATVMLNRYEAESGEQGQRLEERLEGGTADERREQVPASTTRKRSRRG